MTKEKPRWTLPPDVPVFGGTFMQSWTAVSLRRFIGVFLGAAVMVGFSPVLLRRVPLVRFRWVHRMTRMAMSCHGSPIAPCKGTPISSSFSQGPGPPHGVGVLFLKIRLVPGMRDSRRNLFEVCCPFLFGLWVNTRVAGATAWTSLFPHHLYGAAKSLHFRLSLSLG